VKISIFYEKIIAQLQGQRHGKLSGLLTDIDTLPLFMGQEYTLLFFRYNSASGFYIHCKVREIT